MITMKKDHICPYCDHMFQVGSLKYITAKKTKDGKVLRCPRCGKENTFRD